MTTTRTGAPCVPAEPGNPMDNDPGRCKRDELGRGDVDYLTPFRVLGAPVERCEVSRPVSRAAALVFLAPVLCSSGPGLAGNHTSPLIVPPMSRTASLASPDAGAGVPVESVFVPLTVAFDALSPVHVPVGGGR
jgi:hypothetical protein